MQTIRMLALALALLPSLLLADAQPSAIITATDRFELRSDPRVALHHFLIAWAAADHDEWPPYALPLAERGYWRVVLDDDEERTWTAAAEAYAASRGHSVVFDEGLIALRDWAAGIASKESIPAADRPLADAIEQTLPIYRRHWWPAHDTQNRAWIESLAPALRTIENDVPQALELIFHEASHVESLESPLTTLVQEAFRAAGGEAPERFWHDMIFFTTGTITRIVLAEQGQTDYRHYGEFGVYRRGEGWGAQLPLLEQYWQPFLESSSPDASARRAALEAVAEGLLAE